MYRYSCFSAEIGELAGGWLCASSATTWRYPQNAVGLPLAFWFIFSAFIVSLFISWIFVILLLKLCMLSAGYLISKIQQKKIQKKAISLRMCVMQIRETAGNVDTYACGILMLERYCSMFSDVYITVILYCALVWYVTLSNLTPVLTPHCLLQTFCNDHIAKYVIKQFLSPYYVTRMQIIPAFGKACFLTFLCIST